MEIIKNIATIAGCITAVAAAALLLIRPLRDKVLGTQHIKEGQKCLLRSDMLRTYYRHKEEETIRQYEYESFELEYQAYKALGGNSFIEKIHAEVKTWEVIS